MLRPRIIPCLLLKNTRLVKGIQFKNHRYVGDPINAVKIFSDKEVDELVFLDITATNEHRKPSLKLIQDIADECFMPFSVGGGIETLEDIKSILSAGSEKVVLNSYAVENKNLIKEASDRFGSQSVVVSIDVKQKNNQYEVYTHSGNKATGLNPFDLAIEMEKLGAGEIFLTSIDRDGMYCGYDLELIRNIVDIVNIPVICCGGAGTSQHLRDGLEIGRASGVAAGSMFIFHGPAKAILINSLPREEIGQLHKIERQDYAKANM